MFGMAMPLLYGLTAELYFVLPNRKLGENAPTIQLAPIWAQGCALMSITQGLARMAPNNTWLTWLSPVSKLAFHEKGASVVSKQADYCFYYLLDTSCRNTQCESLADND